MEKYSKQREEILEFLKNSKSHPTAEEVYTALKPNDINLSRGTVYRNLNHFVEKGIVRKISISDLPDRFDYIYNSHNHAVCKVCGKVFDFNYDLQSDFNKLIKKQTGLEDFSNEFTIYGICKKCYKKNKI